MAMPTISVFYGITIRMYYLDHPPPHFSAEYQGYDANVAIETGKVIAGHLPRTAARIVRRWALNQREELHANWQRARLNEPLERIPGADAD
jgi:hypothetical protein